MTLEQPTPELAAELAAWWRQAFEAPQTDATFL
jgi:hypothetical protein